MTTPARVAEADRVEALYYYALSKLGVSVVGESLDLWQGSVKVGAGGTVQGAGWLNSAVLHVMKHRSRARDLGLAYYRLIRALRVGETIADPRVPYVASVSLEALRDEFEQVVDTIAPTSQPPLPSAGDDDPIKVVKIEQLEDITKDQDRAARIELETLFESLGLNVLQKKLDATDATKPSNEVAQLYDASRRGSGARVAATAERISLNASRGLAYDLSQVDKRVIGWVRYSQTGSPCGWCAMLISRGFTTKAGSNLYSSSKGSARTSSGEEAADADKYHDNCKCVAVPVFSTAQLSSSLFDRNREYGVLWPQVTKGFSGDAALTVWRRYFREQQLKQLPEVAQVAA